MSSLRPGGGSAQNLTSSQPQTGKTPMAKDTSNSLMERLATGKRTTVSNEISNNLFKLIFGFLLDRQERNEKND